MESNSTGALVLALLAKADKAGELLQKVLMDLEQEFVKNRNFEGFIELCDRTRSLVLEDPILVATMTAGQLNGMRRIPDVDPAEVFMLADQLGVMLEGLPAESQRVQALRANFGYQMGVFSRDVGEFQRATYYQEQARNAYLALGDGVRAAISEFLIAVEQFNHELQEGNSDAAIHRALERLDRAYVYHKPLLQEVPWWWANLPVHIVLAHAQAGEFTSSVFAECLGIVLSLGEKHVHWIRFARALDAYLREDMEGARALFEEIADHPERDRQGDLTVTATLMLGRILAPVDELLATGRYSRAARWSGLKGRQAKAVALRELDRLLAPLQQGP